MTRVGNEDHIVLILVAAESLRSHHADDAKGSAAAATLPKDANALTDNARRVAVGEKIINDRFADHGDLGGGHDFGVVEKTPSATRQLRINGKSGDTP